MGARRSLLLLLALAAGCGDERPIAGDVPLRVTAAVEEVELGKAFPLTVVRVWQRGIAPTAWSDDALAPLAVRLIDTTRREDDRHVEETRRYEAYAFLRDDLKAPVAVRVKPALDPEAPGPPELPASPAPAPARWWLWLLGAAAVLAAVALLARRRPRPAPAPEPVPAAPPPGPHVRALERLARLREQRPGSHAELQSFYVEASGLLRDYAGERFDVSAAEMTTEQLVAAVPRLAGLLGPCDLVKYACYRPDARERERLLDEAATFLRETAE